MAKAILARLLAACRLELHLIVGHWSYWLLQLLWCGWIVYVVAQPRTATGLATTSASHLLMIAAGVVALFISPVSLVLAGNSASRARRNHFEVIEAALPTGAEVILGQWLATILAASGFLIVPLVVVLIIGPWSSFIEALPLFLLKTLTVQGVITGIVWVLHVWVGIRRWMYPVLVVGYVALMMSWQSLVAQLGYGASLLGVGMTWMNLRWSELWGQLFYGDQPVLFDLFYLALLLALGSLIVWQHNRRRLRQRSIGTLAFAFVACSSVLLLGWGYVRARTAVDDQIQQQAQFITDHIEQEVLPAQVPFAVSAYTIDLDLTDPHLPRFNAELQVHNRSQQPIEQLDFSLYAPFTITASSLPYERAGNFVQLKPVSALAPNEALTFTLHYQGQVWHWIGRGPLFFHFARDFVNSQGINLSCSSAWYPIPGRLVGGRTSLWPVKAPDCVFSAPAQFRLKIRQPGQLQFASNLPAVGEQEFFSGGTTWVQLMGAPHLVATVDDRITLVAAPLRLEQVRADFNRLYSPVLTHLQRFFSEIGHVTIFVDNVNADEEVNMPVTGDGLTVFIDRYGQSFAEDQDTYSHYLITEQRLVSSLFGAGQTPLADNVGFFLWVHYLAKGDPARMQTLLAQGIPQSDVSWFDPSLTRGESYPVAQQLYQIYATQGERATIDLLHKLLAAADTLNPLRPKEIVAWIKESMGVP